VLVEGRSKKNEAEWKGRTDTNKMVVFPRGDAEVGEYRRIRVTRSTSATLFGKLMDVKEFRNLTTAHDRGEVLYDGQPHVSAPSSLVREHLRSTAFELPVINS
jgi:hypothetical protein